MRNMIHAWCPWGDRRFTQVLNRCLILLLSNTLLSINPVNFPTAYRINRTGWRKYNSTDMPLPSHSIVIIYNI
jgi:hypothetical protein